MGFMFLGGKDTEVRVHYDVDYSNVFLTQFTGRKKILLFNQDQSEFLYQVPNNTHSLADLKNPDYDKFPALQYAKGYEFIQEPGDGLFMPSGYWHFNTYLSGGISVAYRKMANTPSRLWKGIKFVAFTMPYDKIMNKVLGKKWFEIKQKKCFENGLKAIENFKVQNPNHTVSSTNKLKKL